MNIQRHPSLEYVTFRIVLNEWTPLSSYQVITQLSSPLPHFLQQTMVFKVHKQTPRFHPRTSSPRWSGRIPPSLKLKKLGLEFKDFDLQIDLEGLLKGGRF